jgi:hypothetical protein
MTENKVEQARAELSKAVREYRPDYYGWIPRSAITKYQAALDALIAAAREEGMREERERAAQPDVLMHPEGDCGYPADDLFSLDDEMDVPPGEYRRVRAYRTLPDHWLAHLVLTRDDDGDPNDTELKLFGSESEATTALERKGEG